MGKTKQIFLIFVFLITTLLSLGVSAVSAQNQVFAPSPKNPIIAKIQSSLRPASTSSANQSSPKATEKMPGQAALVPRAKPTEGTTFTREGNRVIATDANGWLATFTDGARTVSMRGPQRTFSEPGVASAVNHTVWVRVLPAPFSGSVNEKWLNTALNDRSLDILSMAMQYVAGSPTLQDGMGRIYASDADYGPLNPDGTRQEGSDFNDYLGISFTYDTGSDNPEAAQLGAMDCSGYMRMVWGYRQGLKMTNQTDGRNNALPRRAVQMYASGPGITLISQGANAQASLGILMPGDLVFQDASADDGTAIDHVGLYLGKDSAGNYRFISSRKTANGPTMGDLGGKSILNGSGLYAKSFVAARRL